MSREDWVDEVDVDEKTDESVVGSDMDRRVGERVREHNIQKAIRNKETEEQMRRELDGDRDVDGCNVAPNGVFGYGSDDVADWEGWVEKEKQRMDVVRLYMDDYIRAVEYLEKMAVRLADMNKMDLDGLGRIMLRMGVDLFNEYNGEMRIVREELGRLMGGKIMGSSARGNLEDRLGNAKAMRIKVGLILTGADKFVEDRGDE